MSSDIKERLREVYADQNKKGAIGSDMFCHAADAIEALEGEVEQVSALLRASRSDAAQCIRERGAANARAERLEAEAAALRVTQERQNSDTMLLRQCYVTLAFAFYRLHESARSRDGELCLDFQRVRALIEKRFREIGIKL